MSVLIKYNCFSFSWKRRTRIRQNKFSFVSSIFLFRFEALKRRNIIGNKTITWRIIKIEIRSSEETYIVQVERIICKGVKFISCTKLDWHFLIIWRNNGNKRNFKIDFFSFVLCYNFIFIKEDFIWRRMKISVNEYF